MAKGLARQVPLTKLVQLNRDIHLYLVSLIVVALSCTKEALVVPDDLELQRILCGRFNLLLAENTDKDYHAYGTLEQTLLGVADLIPKEAD